MKIPKRNEVSREHLARGEMNASVALLAAGIGDSEDLVNYSARSRLGALSMFLIDGAVRSVSEDDDQPYMSFHHAQLLAQGFVATVKAMIEDGDYPEWLAGLDLPDEDEE